MRKIVKNTRSGQRAQQLINPIKDKKGSYRTYRNEGINYPTWLELSRRDPQKANHRNFGLGFRIVRNA